MSQPRPPGQRGSGGGDDDRPRGRVTSLRPLAARFRTEFSDFAGTGFLLGVGASVLTRFWMLLVGLVASVVITRALGPEGRGLYAVALTMSMIATQVGVFGLHRANVWAISRDRQLLGPLIANSLLASLVAGMLSAAALLAIAIMMPSQIPLPPGLLILVIASVPISIALTLLNNLLVGLDRIRAYNGMLLINRMGNAGLAIAFVMLGIATASSLFLAVVLVGAAGVAIATYSLVQAATTPIRVSLSVLRDHAGYGLRAFGVSIAFFLLLRVDILIIQAMLGVTQAGYYAVSVAIIEMMRILPAVFGSLLLARLSRGAGGSSRWRTTKISALSIGVLMAAGAAAAALVAGPAITLLYGDAFAASVDPLLILLPGLVFIAINGVLVSYLGAIGMPRGAVVAPAAALVVNILLNLWLIPRAGIEGAATASTIAYGLMLVLTILFVRFGVSRDGGDNHDGPHRLGVPAMPTEV